MTESFLIVESFLDGNRVEAEALKQALAGEDGRDHLVQMLALREVVGGRDAAFPAAVERPAAARRWLGVAALVAMSVIGGYAIGHRNGRSTPKPTIGASSDVVPTPSRVIEIKQWDRTNEGN